MPGGEDAVMKAWQRLTCYPQMPGHEAAVLNLYPAVVIIQRGEIERIAHHLAPVLPSHQYVMIIVVVQASDMFGEGRRTVMVDAAALIFGIEIVIPVVNINILTPIIIVL